MSSSDAITYVLDDDLRIRESLTALLASVGRKVVTFSTAEQFLAFPRPDVPACLILDMRLGSTSGLDLLPDLSGPGLPPIIFLTGYGDIPSTVKAMKGGASEFLSKPYDETELMEAINTALARSELERKSFGVLQVIQARYATLTPRERDTLPYVVSGLLNKQTADRMGTSEITVRVHRGQIMRKMKADSLADLVRLAAKLGIP